MNSARRTRAKIRSPNGMVACNVPTCCSRVGASSSSCARPAVETFAWLVSMEFCVAGKEAPTKPGLEVHLPEREPGGLARRVLLTMRAFAGSVTRCFGRSTNVWAQARVHLVAADNITAQTRTPPERTKGGAPGTLQGVPDRSGGLRQGNTRGAPEVPHGTSGTNGP
jgi:hypothetical protein